MKKLLLLLSLTLTQSVFCNSTNEKMDLSEHPFLDQSQLIELYDLFIQEIETYDAESIETRNNKKALSWNQFKKLKRSAFIESISWKELAQNFYSFAQGFTNLHSKFKFNPSIKFGKEQSNVGIAYTYPEISFFINDDKHSKIISMNDEPIKLVFQNYENTNCPFNSTIGCLSNFVNSFKKGKIFVKGEKVKLLNTKSGVIPIVYNQPQNITQSKSSQYLNAIDIKDYNDWDLIGQGHKVAVFKKNNLALVKIKDFVYTARSDDDFKCLKKSPEKSMCSDVQLMRSSLNKIDSTIDTLIIDVQNNGGGNENTPILAELSSNEFQELRVQYKNTPLINDAQLRKYLFYGSQKAESWFQSLTQTNDTFLPIRSDFCQADDLCGIKPIKPNSQRKYAQVYVLTNQNCVSSCDDFVWRMQEYSQAKIVGLPNAADATYSRVSILFYLNKNNTIKTVYFGDGGQAKFDGIEIFQITIPYSKTVDKNGHLKQGVPAELDFIIPVTIKNFNGHEKDSLNKLTQLISN